VNSWQSRLSGGLGGADVHLTGRPSPRARRDAESRHFLANARGVVLVAGCVHDVELTERKEQLFERTSSLTTYGVIRGTLGATGKSGVASVTSCDEQRHRPGKS